MNERDLNIFPALTLPGHGSSLHGRLSSPTPGHDCPPKAGEGLVQVRLLVSSPPPQVTGQEDQGSHSDQFPSTGQTKKKTYLKSTHS